MSYAIETEGLVRRFGGTAALGGVDLAVRAGTVLGLLGPNGAGKTTAVRVLATLLRPDGGTARVGGHDVVREAHQVRRIIGLTGQYAAVDQTLTGRENLLLLGRLLGLGRRQARLRAHELLDRFGLAEVAGRPARTYSGGTRRRLDLAASMVGRPRVLFLDEPTTGLDPASRGEAWTLVRDLVADGTTVLLTTQYLDEADVLADEIAVLDAGRVVAAGPPDELKRRVGRQVLRVRAPSPAEVPDLVREVAALAGPPQVDGTLITVAAGPGLHSAVLHAVDRAGLSVDELTVREPSLDEVFLALTGARSTPAADRSTVDTA